MFLWGEALNNACTSYEKGEREKDEDLLPRPCVSAVAPAADLSGVLAGSLSRDRRKEITMKRYFYIAAFMFLGFLVSLLVHAAVEIPTLAIIMADPDEMADNYLWQH
ncbi:MAG: hypothetical protein WBO92_00675 [Candidatus Moraniibacteriota bacterium]